MRADTREEVLEVIRAHEKEIRGLGVHRLKLFGSFRRETPTASSDVDLLVEFDLSRKSFDNFIALAHLLEEILGRPVELVTVESLSPYIGPGIREEAEDVLAA